MVKHVFSEIRYIPVYKFLSITKVRPRMMHMMGRSAHSRGTSLQQISTLVYYTINKYITVQDRSRSVLLYCILREDRLWVSSGWTRK